MSGAWQKTVPTVSGSTSSPTATMPATPGADPRPGAPRLERGDEGGALLPGGERDDEARCRCAKDSPLTEGNRDSKDPIAKAMDASCGRCLPPLRPPGEPAPLRRHLPREARCRRCQRAREGHRRQGRRDRRLGARHHRSQRRERCSRVPERRRGRGHPRLPWLRAFFERGRTRPVHLSPETPTTDARSIPRESSASRTRHPLPTLSNKSFVEILAKVRRAGRRCRCRARHERQWALQSPQRQAADPGLAGRSTCSRSRSRGR